MAAQSTACYYSSKEQELFLSAAFSGDAVVKKKKIC